MAGPFLGLPSMFYDWEVGAFSRKKQLFRATKFFQFANRSIDQTFEAEKKMKDDLSDVPFA